MRINDAELNYNFTDLFCPQNYLDLSAEISEQTAKFCRVGYSYWLIFVKGDPKDQLGITFNFIDLAK